MSGLLVDTRLFEYLVGENLPNLATHFHKIHMSISLMVSSWFLCLFINYLPAETAFVVWDNVMLDGVVVLFEVGLAILRMHQSTLLRIKDPIDTTHWLNKQLAIMYDPSQLWSNIRRLDKVRIETARLKIRKKVEADSNRKIEDRQLHELEHRTHFDTTELRTLWQQYTSIDRFLYYGAIGLDFDLFSQLVAGTFSEWWPDNVLLRRLFTMSDTNEDGFVDFAELSLLLSTICRGTFKQKTKFCFELFDPKNKGSIDRFDVYRMLQSVYAMYIEDDAFYAQLSFFVDMIFEAVTINKDGSVSQENFADVVSFQPQIMQRYCERNPKVKYDTKKTLYYWLFDPDSSKCADLIKIAISRGSASKDVQMHVVNGIDQPRTGCLNTCFVY